MTTNDPAAIIADAIRSLKAESIYRSQCPKGDLLVHPTAALISLFHARTCIEEIIRTGGRLPREAWRLCELLKSKEYHPLPYWLQKKYFEDLCPPGQFDPLSELCWMAPEWENPARDEDIENFTEDSTAIVFAVENSVQAPEPAQIPASTPGPDNRPYYLNTNKNRDKQARIFYELAKWGFIRKTDPDTGADLLADFLDAFDKDAAKQGRIFWIKTATRTPDKINKRGLLDFVALMEGKARQFVELAPILSAVFPEVQIKRPDYSKFFTRWYDGKFSQYHSELLAIIDKGATKGNI